ncbi:hypothetical protein PHLCEN_2v11180 [Hermanssonia centrifuga]|uniref:UDENN domain-containing protein n=1 Tax=Hermanssonia centrifuga TaxID=98765 RepID=A0A2R6NKR4_9APHY|nr:hypothetical protein PHLCEN_2v11180 [Hermanssonia centrifuga]
MSEEEDIGLYNLSRRSDSLAGSPPPRQRNPRRLSIVSVLRGEQRTPIKSPSNPNLLNGSPKMTARKLSRSNTMPRLQRSNSSRGPVSDELDNLSMDVAKAVKMRRKVLGFLAKEPEPDLVSGTVDFDLDYGPKITSIYPPLDLSDPEAENIAFSSFPDSPQSESGSYIHSFRIRHPEISASDPPPKNSPVTKDGFIYGFSHFTQRRDPTSKRGYQQRSLVILSQHEYPSLFYTLLSYLGQSFLSHGGPMLEVACHNIASWSDPQPGSTLELGFLGYVFSVELPSTADTQQSSMAMRTVERYDPDSHIMASLSPQDPPILSAFEASFSHIWSIWECLVLCEPIFVYGPSAATTSQIIWWLRDLLRPIPLAGDFRPFFTIHDAEHAALVNSRAPQAGLLLGVTNPFFERACKHWPHVLSLGSPRYGIFLLAFLRLPSCGSNVFAKGRTRRDLQWM